MLSKINLIMPFICGVILISCYSVRNTALNSIYVKKGQQFYGYDYSGAAATLTRYEAIKRFKATFKEEGDAVYFKCLDNIATHVSEIASPNVTPRGGSYELPEARASAESPKFFHSVTEGTYASECDADGEDCNKYFRYRQVRLYLQTIAIPLKFRSALENVPRQVESGLTFALAPGFKHSWVTYLGGKNALGLTSTSLSIAGGGLIGFGTVDINKKSTQGRVSDDDATKNAIIPVGLHLGIGINNINLGLVYGQDIITGPNRKEWNYEGEPWVGILFGIDIIK